MKQSIKQEFLMQQWTSINYMNKFKEIIDGLEVGSAVIWTDGYNPTLYVLVVTKIMENDFIEFLKNSYRFDLKIESESVDKVEPIDILRLKTLIEKEDILSLKSFPFYSQPFIVIENFNMQKLDQKSFISHYVKYFYENWKVKKNETD